MDELMPRYLSGNTACGLRFSEHLCYGSCVEYENCKARYSKIAKEAIAKAEGRVRGK